MCGPNRMPRMLHCSKVGPEGVDRMLHNRHPVGILGEEVLQRGYHSRDVANQLPQRPDRIGNLFDKRFVRLDPAVDDKKPTRLPDRSILTVELISTLTMVRASIWDLERSTAANSPIWLLERAAVRLDVVMAAIWGLDSSTPTNSHLINNTEPVEVTLRMWAIGVQQPAAASCVKDKAMTAQVTRLKNPR